MNFIFNCTKDKLFGSIRRFNWLSILCIVLIPIPGLAQEFQVDVLKYRILSENPNTVEVSGYLYQEDEINGIDAVVIPETVDYEGSNYTVVSIGDKAFYVSFSYKTKIKTIKLPESLTEIGSYAFANCNMLEYISIPQTVRIIGMGAFNGCESLKNISLPEGIEEIGVSMFEDCNSLESVIIPGTVTKIERYSFWGCTNLNYLYLPKSVTNCNRYSFTYCLSLTDIVVEEGNPAYSSRGGMLFNQDKTILELCPSAEKDFIIPDGVERVGYLGNTRVSSITIPTTVKQIDTCAFEESFSLKSVICYPIIPPILGDYGFWGPSYGSTENLFHGIVYVPSVSMNAYLNSGWSRYILEPIPGYDPNPDSAVNEIFNEVVPERYEVYGIDGRLVISTTEKAEVQALPKGIYIVNGIKIAL